MGFLSLRPEDVTRPRLDLLSLAALLGTLVFRQRTVVPDEYELGREPDEPDA